MVDWFRRATVLEVQGKAPNTAPTGGDLINPPTTANFFKLCNDFASLGGKTFFDRGFRGGTS